MSGDDTRKCPSHLTCLGVQLNQSLRDGKSIKKIGCARRRLARGATKRSMTTLKEFQAPEADFGETVHAARVGWMLQQSQLYGGEERRKGESHLGKKERKKKKRNPT